jgi:restriction system protein
MVRSGSGGAIFEEFREQSIVTIGWQKVGDVSEASSRAEITKTVAAAWPEWSKGKAISGAGQLYRFAHEIRVGDGVVTYDPSRRAYLVGTIKSDYQYKKQRLPEDAHVRKVEWTGEIARDDLRVTTKNSLGSILTIFLLPEEAANDVLRVLHGTPLGDDDSETEEIENEEELLKDIQSRAIEFIKDEVSKLDWERMQDLVAGLLESMGYKTRVSPSGPDRGKDIVASPDGFGFESPRIVVEVKHRNTQMGSQEVRSFLGGRHKDDKGLYVSIGGFSREAYYEAERANIPCTLMNIDDLVQAIIEHYESMDVETQRLIPVKKVYWPA